MDKEKVILLSVELDNDSLIDAARVARVEIDKLKAQQKELTKAGKENTAEFEHNAAALRAAQTEYREVKKVIDNLAVARKAEIGSNEESRAQLAVLTKQYNVLSQAQRDETEDGRNLQAQIKSLSDELKKNESAVGDNRRNLGNYGEGVQALKKELKDLQDQMASLDAGSEKYQEATQRAGELKDKISDIKEDIKAQAGDSGFEKFSNTTGVLTDKLKNLDFKGVAEQAKNLSSISKAMTFKETTAGLKDMVSGLGSMAKAILANPIFLLAAVVTAVVLAIKEYSDAVDNRAVEATNNFAEGLKVTIALQEEYIERTNKLTDNSIRLAEAKGESEDKLFERRKQKLKEDNKLKKDLDAEYFSQIEELQKRSLKSTDAEQQKALDEQVDGLRKSQRENYKSILDYGMEVQILEAEHNKAVADEKDKLNKDLKKKNEDRSKNEYDEMIKRLGDAKAGVQKELIGVEEYSSEYIKLKSELFAKERDLELAAKGLTNNQKLLIEAQYAEAVKQLGKDAIKFNEDRAKENFEKQIKVTQDLGEQKRLLFALETIQRKQDIEKNFNEGLITEAQHNEQLAQLELQSSNRIKQIKIDELSEEAKLYAEGSTEKLRIDTEAAELSLQINKSVEDKKREEIKKTAEAHKISTAAQLSAAQDLFGGLASLFKEGSTQYKAFSSLQVIASTINGAMGAFAQASAAFPPPFGQVAGAIAAGVVSAQGALNLTKINALAKGGIINHGKAEKGMIIGGEPHSRGGTKFFGTDGTMFEAERDELLAVVNKRSTGLLQNLSNLNVMGGGNNFFQKGGLTHLADGGFAARAVSQPTKDQFQANALMQRIIESIPAPIVRVQDINQAQGTLAAVEDGATI